MDVTRRIIVTLGLLLAALLIFLALGMLSWVLDQLGIGWMYWVLLVGFLAWYVWKMVGDLSRYKEGKQ